MEELEKDIESFARMVEKAETRLSKAHYQRIHDYLVELKEYRINEGKL